MKKIVSVIVVFMMSVSLCACGGTNSSNGSAKNTKELHEITGDKKSSDTTKNSSSQEQKQNTDEEQYNNALTLAKQYEYSKAADILEKINYSDSAELANRYRQMSTTRFINHRFYFYPDEFASIFQNNLTKLGRSNTNYTTTVDENDSTEYCISFTDPDYGTLNIYLSDVKDDGSFGECGIMAENSTFFAYASLCGVTMLSAEPDGNKASDFFKKALESTPDSVEQDGLSLAVTQVDNEMALLICDSEN